MKSCWLQNGNLSWYPEVRWTSCTPPWGWTRAAGDTVSVSPDCHHLHPCRYLKSQEVRGRRGEVFRHPDIATLSMDEVGSVLRDIKSGSSSSLIHRGNSNKIRCCVVQIFSEMIRTSSGQELERRLSETLGMMEIKRAWTSSRLFADHPVLTRPLQAPSWSLNHWEGPY